MQRPVRPLLLTAALVAGCAAEPDGPATEESVPAVEEDRLPLVLEGFAAPEAALHDTRADVYLIANIDGDASAKDGNGYISRVTPDGEVEARWIDGTAEGVELDAPKGMEASGDTLFVADIDVVRLFRRDTGAPLGSWPVEGAEFLNDLVVGADGALYVTDTTAGVVYRLGPEGPTVIANDSALAGPNGIDALPDGRLLVVGFLGVGTHTIDPRTGALERQPGATTARSDGVVLLEDGGHLVANWEAQAILRFAPGATEADTVVRGVESPAAIAWDATRRRVIVPLLQLDRVEVHAVP